MSYLDELKNELQKRHVSPSAIAEIIADHEDLIREATNEGLSEAQWKTKFGDPSRLAAELSQSLDSNEEDDVSSLKPWKTFPLNTPELSIDVKLINEDIRIRIHEKSEIAVLTFGKIARLEDYLCTVQNGLLTLHAPKSHGISFFGDASKDPAFEIRLPKETLLLSIKVTTVNGNGLFHHLEASHLEAVTTNGDLQLDHGVLGRLKYNTVNGDVHIDNVAIGTLHGSAVSGDVSIHGSKIKGDLILNSVSGDADVRDSGADYAEMSTVSGDLNGTEFYPVRLALKSVSGDISIQNKRRDAVEVVRQSTVSGSIRISSSS